MRQTTLCAPSLQAQHIAASPPGPTFTFSQRFDSMSRHAVKLPLGKVSLIVQLSVEHGRSR